MAKADRLSDINFDEDRIFARHAKIAGEALLARLMIHHPEYMPDYLRPKPPPKPEPEPVSPKPAPIPVPKKVRRRISVEEVQSFVCREYDISCDLLVSHLRVQRLIEPRFIAIYLAHELRPRIPLSALGRKFCRDHTSILHAVRKTAQRRKDEPTLNAKIEAIQSGFLAQFEEEAT